MLNSLDGRASNVAVPWKFLLSLQVRLYADLVVRLFGPLFKTFQGKGGVFRLGFGTPFGTLLDLGVSSLDPVGSCRDMLRSLRDQRVLPIRG